MDLTSNLLSSFWEVAKSKDQQDCNEDIIEQDFHDQLDSYLFTIGHILWCDLSEDFYINSLNWFTDILAYVFSTEMVHTLIESVVDIMNIFLYQIKNFNE